MIEALRAKYRKAMGDAEEIRKKYNGQPGNLTEDEESRWTQYLDEADGIKSKIEQLERQEALTTWAKSSAGAPEADNQNPSEEKNLDEKATLQNAAFKKLITGGKEALSPAELKALAADNPASGGYLATPQQFLSMLLQNIKDMVFVRQMATIHTLTSAESLGVPYLDGDIDDADWTTELATGNEDTGLKFGKRELKPNPLAKRVKISDTLIRKAAIDPGTIVRDRMGYKFGIAQEKAYMVGTGANQPLGVFTVTTDGSGITTARDSVCASATNVGADDFIDCKHALKGQYWSKSAWYLHRDCVKRIRKLKDGNNNYIWSPGLGPGGGITGGNPETLLERPYYMSEYAPNTFTSGNYIAILGDWSYYWIVDALQMQLKVLNELYAEQNMVGFIGRLESDGMPVLEEAFQRLRLA